MDLLNLDNNKFGDKPRESFVDPDAFNPDPAKGQQGVYKAVGRFLPWWKNPNESKYRKDIAFMTNPLTKDRLVVDCPSTVNLPSVLWAIDKKLKDRERNHIDEDMVKEIRQYFSRFCNFYSPFYLFKDPQVMSLENTIKIFAFGFNIDKMIQKEINPAGADKDLQMDIPMVKSINPFSLIEGKDFLVVVKKKSKKYKDYDDCKFLEQVTPFRFMLDGQKHIVTVEELQQLAGGAETPISRFLMQNTPNLEKYAYRPWTDDTYKQVAAYLKAILPYRSFMQEIIDDCRDEKMKQLLTAITVNTIPPMGSVQQPAPLAQQTLAPQNFQQQAPAPQQAAPAWQAPAPQPQQPPVQPQMQAPVNPPVQQTPAPVEPPVQMQPAPTPAEPPTQAQQAPQQPLAAGPVNESNEFENMLNAL